MKRNVLSTLILGLSSMSFGAQATATADITFGDGSVVMSDPIAGGNSGTDGWVSPPIG